MYLGGMGCWNATCSLSGLPITYRTPVKFLLLIAGRDQYEWGKGAAEVASAPAAGTTNPNDLWAPGIWPIDGLYDDAGLIESIKIPAPEMFQHRMADLRTADQEEAPFFLSITKHLNRDSDLAGRLYSGELKHRNPFGRTSPLGHTFIRRDIWDALLDVSLTSVWGPWTRAAMRESARQLVDGIFLGYDAIKRDGSEEAEIAICKWSMSTVLDLDDSPDHLIRALKGEFRWFPAMVSTILMQAGRSGREPDREGIHAAACEVADLAHVHAILSPLRKAWMPGTARGSQDASWDLHKAFSDMVGTIADRARKEEEER